MSIVRSSTGPDDATHARRSWTGDILLTAIAPTIWGSTYIVTSEFLPGSNPLAVALLRSLIAGLVLLVFVRKLPQGIWWIRTFILGALNFSIFLTLLFIAAYRLPGGVAATVLSIQPLLVILFSWVLLGIAPRALAITGSAAGIVGVALLVLTPKASLDIPGVLAGLAGSVSMALGVVLSRRWHPPASALAIAAWQLTAGGLLLVPVALVLQTPLPPLNASSLFGIAWLSIVGASLTYILWFRGIERLEPAVVSSLGLLSPMVATLLGWLILHETLSLPQIAGMVLVVGGIWLGQRTAAR